MDADEEDEQRVLADGLIEDAFAVVRPILRSEAPRGLWYYHNAEYGFVRNLLGSRSLWVGLSVAGTVAASVPWWHGQTASALDLSGLWLAVGSLLLALGLGWLVLPAHIKQVADRYAESAWSELVEIDRRSGAPRATPV